MTAKIAITGAAGLVGQNLVPRLKARGFRDVVAIDKHPANTALLRALHPEITVIAADLAEAGAWENAIADADVIVICHAQIGGLDTDAFARHNVTATQRLLEAIRRRDVYLVHISTAVVNSPAYEMYAKSKQAQERLVLDSAQPTIVLRPTLMFGWFDRKHLGWLARFMQRSPVFPVPGNGRYLRQPLYAGDFCEIVMSCIARRPAGEIHTISGLEPIEFIDLIRRVREACGARAWISPIPYTLFRSMLMTYALFDRDPPFTVKQLEAFVAPDWFEVIDWPGIFGVTPTPLQQALADTFRHPVYSKVALEF